MDAVANTINTADTAPQTAFWSPVLALSLCVATLIASEFMPVSLLSPIAADLNITAGQTGQAISISGAFAVLTSIFIASLIKRIDRRTVVLTFTGLLILSGLIVTFAPSYYVLMVGRALLGVAIGGFWSISTALIMRLLPIDLVPKGLALLNAGNAIAATIAAPLGSFLGAYVGWRGALFMVVPLGLLALVWQWSSLPALAPQHGDRSANVFKLLARSPVSLGMSSILFLFMGQFALFTYLRPFLEQVTQLNIQALSLMLLVIGLAGVAGTWCIGRLLQKRLFSILTIIPLAMALLAAGLIVFGATPVMVSLLLVAWGFFGTAAPVGWGTWLTRTMPDDAEAGGGLLVAVIQLAITAGASLGGFLFDSVGWWSTFMMSAVLLCASSLLATAAWQKARSSSQ